MMSSDKIPLKVRDRVSAVITSPSSATDACVHPPPQSDLPIRLLHPEAILPTRSSEFAAGLDLYASADKIIRARRQEIVPTGIAIALPEDCVGLVWPRSGLAAKFGIDTLAGVIDADYRGEIRIVLMNHGTMDYPVKRGDRLAQLLIQKIERLTPVEVDALPDTRRGSGGFGSSGK